MLKRFLASETCFRKLKKTTFQIKIKDVCFVKYWTQVVAYMSTCIISNRILLSILYAVVMKLLVCTKAINRIY